MDRVVVKLEQYLAPMDEGNDEKQVRSRLMNQYGHVMMIISFVILLVHVFH